jgi:hypothetical protein
MTEISRSRKYVGCEIYGPDEEREYREEEENTETVFGENGHGHVYCSGEWLPCPEENTAKKREEEK